MLNDNTEAMFNAKSYDVGYALGANDLPRAATAVGVMIGLTAAELPEADARAFFCSVFDFNVNDADEIANVASYVIRIRSNLD